MRSRKRSVIRIAAAALTLALVTGGCGGGGGPGFVIPLPVAGLAPAAQIWVQDATIGTGGGGQFFHGQGVDADGDVVGYEWDFESDGTFDSTDQFAIFPYATEGLKTVTLRVTDDEGATTTATAVISVRNAPPTASAPTLNVRAFTLCAQASKEILFIAEAEDPDGDAITNFAWDFESDGTIDVAVDPTGRQKFTYATSDTFKCTCTVTDADGATTEASVAVALCDPGTVPELPPALQIVRGDGIRQTTAGGSITFCAVGGDVDGGMLPDASYTWDLNNDGIFDNGVGQTVTTDFGSVVGAYNVRVRALDDEGNSAEAMMTALVLAAPGAAGPPNARAWAETILAPSGEAIQFHGRGNDPAGDPVTLSWDFDGDGIEDSTASNPIFTFPVPGIYRPTLTVTDGAETAEADLTVVIEDCNDAGPGPYFWFDCDPVTIFHGGRATISMGPGVVAGSSPTMFSVKSINGTIGGDFAAAELATPGLGPLPTGLMAVPGVPIAITIDSIAVDGPPGLEVYTVTTRLVDPGVRVQILKCRLSVAHDVVNATFDIAPFEISDQWNAHMRVRVNAGGQPFGGILPEVFAVEIHRMDQTPNMTNLNFVPMTITPGWIPANIPEGIQFGSMTPLVDGGSDLEFTFNYQTGAGVAGPPVTQGTIILRGNSGEIVGRQAIPYP